MSLQEEACKRMVRSKLDKVEKDVPRSGWCPVTVDLKKDTPLPAPGRKPTSC
jgi:hypothetical protein